MARLYRYAFVLITLTITASCSEKSETWTVGPAETLARGASIYGANGIAFGPDGNLRVASVGGAMARACQAGLGLALMPALVEPIYPRLERVRGERAPDLDLDLPSFPLWLTAHQSRRHNPPVAALWSFLDELLQERDEADDRQLLHRLHPDIETS